MHYVNIFQKKKKNAFISFSGEENNKKKILGGTWLENNISFYIKLKEIIHV